MRPVRFGLIGEYQSGKSLFVNCLLQRPVATVGGGNATTRTVVNYRYGELEYVEYTTDSQKKESDGIGKLAELDTRTDVGVIDVYLKIDLLKHYTLTDMPGFGANEADNEMARKILPEIDFAILIAWSEKSFGSNSDSYKSLQALKEYHIPYFFLLNCTKTERWRCDDEGNLAIANQDMSMMSFYPPENYPLQENGLNIVNLMWYWYSICKSNDELINRRANQLALAEYGIDSSIKEQLCEVSNFNLIKKLFDMEHREYLELKRSIKEEIDALKRELCPIGTIQTFAFNRIPEGWLACDGRILYVNDFHELYYVIGNTFGGDGKTQFALPDLRGRFVRGWNNSAGLDSNRKFGSYQEDAFQNHAHGFDPTTLETDSNGRHWHYTYAYWHHVGNWGSNTKALKELRNQSDNHDSEGDTDRDGSHSHKIQSATPEKVIKEPIQLDNSALHTGQETRPHNVALMFCIRVK